MFEQSLLTNLRRMFICMDHWHGLTMEDIRRLEKATTQELEQVSNKQNVVAYLEKYFKSK